MLFSLLSLLLSVRTKQQYSNIIQWIIGKVSFLKRLSSKQYIIFLFFLDILFGLTVVSVIHAWLYSPAYRQQWESGFIVFLLLYSILKGVNSYRKTHIPPFQELIELAPVPAKNIHITSVIAEWIWIGFTNFSTFFIYFMFQGYITDSIDFYFWIKHVNVLILSIFLFVLSNKLYGAYMYNIVVKKIGWIRLIFFSAVSSIFFMLGRLFISGFILPFYEAFRQNFHSIHSAVDNASWIQLSEQLVSLYSNQLHSIQVFLFLEGSTFLQVQQFISLPAATLLLAAGVLGLLIIPAKWIPTEETNSTSHFKDLFHWYLRALHKVRYLIFRADLLIYKDLRVLQGKRWLLSKEFFNYSFISYEAVFYAGVFTGFLSAVESPALQVQLLFTMNVIIMVNQALEMRVLTPSLFSISAEKQNIWLYQLSLSSLFQFFRSKIKLFYCLFFFPSLFLTLFNFFMMLIYEIYDVQMVILIIGIFIGFFIFPLIQLYLFPFVTKFNFIHEYEIGTTKEETGIVDKGQSFIRSFLVMPFIYYLIVSSFFPVLQHSVKVVNVLSILYFSGVSFICWIYCHKMISKGIGYVEKIKIYSISE